MDAPRHLLPTPTGVLAALGQAPDHEGRRFLEHIVLAGRPLPIDMPGFAATLGLPVASIARLLFAFNRNHHISVMEESPSPRMGWADAGLGAVVDDLVALAMPGQKLLLASADGFCIARVGWTHYEADVMATRRPSDYQPSQGEIFPLYLASRCYYLSATARIDQKNPALLSLGYRLLQGFLPLTVKEAVPC